MHKVSRQKNWFPKWMLSYYVYYLLYNLRWCWQTTQSIQILILASITTAAIEASKHPARPQQTWNLSATWKWSSSVVSMSSAVPIDVGQALLTEGKRRGAPSLKRTSKTCLMQPYLPDATIPAAWNEGDEGDHSWRCDPTQTWHRHAAGETLHKQDRRSHILSVPRFEQMPNVRLESSHYWTLILDPLINVL